MNWTLGNVLKCRKNPSQLALGFTVLPQFEVGYGQRDGAPSFRIVTLDKMMDNNLVKESPLQS